MSLMTNMRDSILDLAILREAVGGEEEMMAEILRMARGELLTIRRTLHDALRSEESDLVRRKAHLLRGFLLNLGATPICRIAERMERSAASGDLRFAEESMGELDALLERLEGDLDRILVRAVA